MSDDGTNICSVKCPPLKPREKIREQNYLTVPEGLLKYTLVFSFVIYIKHTHLNTASVELAIAVFFSFHTATMAGALLRTRLKEKLFMRCIYTGYICISGFQTAGVVMGGLNLHYERTLMNMLKA